MDSITRHARRIKDLEESNKELRDKLKSIDGQAAMDSITRHARRIKDLEESNKELRDKLKSIDGQIQGLQTYHRLLNRLFTELQSRSELEKHILDLDKRIRKLEFAAEVKINSTFIVILSNLQDLPLEIPYKLEQCLHVEVPSKFFNESSCEYKMPMTGMYAKNISVTQIGEGEVEVYLCLDGIVSTSVAKTGRDKDKYNRQIISKLDKGQTLSLKAKRLSGNPGVFVTFSGWLIDSRE